MSDARSTIPGPAARPPAACVDLYEFPDFSGERRRFFPFARFDKALLEPDIISVRIGDQVRLCMTLTDGRQHECSGEVAILDLRGIRSLEILPAFHTATRRRAA